MGNVAAKLEMMEELARQMREEIAKGYGDEELGEDEVEDAMDSAKDMAMTDGELPSALDGDDDDDEELEDDEGCEEPSLHDSVGDFMKKKKSGTPAEGAMVVVKSMQAKPAMKLKKKAKGRR